MHIYKIVLDCLLSVGISCGDFNYRRFIIIKLNRQGIITWPVIILMVNYMVI